MICPAGDSTKAEVRQRVGELGLSWLVAGAKRHGLRRGPGRRGQLCVVRNELGNNQIVRSKKKRSRSTVLQAQACAFISISEFLLI